MLAVHQAMDALARSSHSSERHSLLREPSAEDLDAAHQLVSSARGERMIPHLISNGGVHGVPEAGADQPVVISESSEPERAASEVTERDVSGGFGQVCRYVFMVTCVCHLLCRTNTLCSFGMARSSNNY